MKTGVRTLGPASLKLSHSQVIPANLRGGLLELSKLHSKEPGQGHASKLLKQVCQEADKNKVILMVLVDPFEDGLSKQELRDWYSRLGFDILQETPTIMTRMPELSHV